MARLSLLVLLCTALLGAALAQPTVTLSNTPVTLDEDIATPSVYTFTRSGSTTGALTVLFSVGGDAVLDTDYTATSMETFSFMATDGTIEIPDGSATATIDISPIANTIVQNTRTVTLQITNDIAYFTGTTGQVVTSITSDDEAPVRVQPQTTRVVEGDSVFVRYIMDGNRDIPITVTARVGGTALASDYTITGGLDNFNATSGFGEITFPANNGASLIDVTLDITQDGLGEPKKEIFFQVIDGALYSLGVPPNATLTLNDNDPPAVFVSVAPTSVAENSGDDIVFTFTRSSNDTADTTLTFFWDMLGTAERLTHYTVVPNDTFSGPTDTTGVLQFGVGIEELTLTVTPIDDALHNADRTVVVELIPDAAYVLGTTGNVTATIVNDDTEVFLAVTPATVAETSLESMEYTFTRVGILSSELVVDFLVGGTATFPSDYTVSGETTYAAGTGSITFAVGEDTHVLTVTPVDDTDVEADETVALTLEDGAGYTPGTVASVIGTITNNDLNDVSLSAAPTSVREDSGTPFVYTFTRSGDNSNQLTVNFNVGGSAGLSGVGGTDYTESGASTFSSTSGTIVILANSNSAQLRLTPVADNQFEANETISIQLAAGTGYNILTPSPVVVTIRNDDDGTNTISLTGSNLELFESSSTPVTLTFTRVGDLQRRTIVKFLVGGTARFGVDYTQTGASVFTETEGDIIFETSQSTRTIELFTVVNEVVDDTRSIIINLLSDNAYAVDASQNSVTAVIFDDDIVTIDNLEPAVSAASGIQLMAIKLRQSLEFPDRDLTAREMRVVISNFLAISSRYVDVVDVFLENAELRLLSVPNGASAEELADRLLLAINSKDPVFFGTVLQDAIAFLVAATFADPPSFNQNFGIDQGFIDDLIGSVESDDFDFLYYYYYYSDASTVRPVAWVVVMCLLPMLLLNVNAVFM